MTLNRKEKETYRKWLFWIDVVYKDLRSIIANRKVYFELYKIIRNNKRIDTKNYYNTFCIECYKVYIIMGIRRLIENDKDSISFIGLLEDIYSSKIIYNKLGIDGKKLKKDIRSIKEKSGPFKKMADKYFAHNDRSYRSKTLLLRRNEINSFIDLLARIYMEYCFYLQGDDYGIWPPNGNYIGNDWKNIFKTPWITE